MIFRNSSSSSMSLNEGTQSALDDFFWLGWGWGHVGQYLGVSSTITICKFLMVLHHRSTHHKHHSLDGNSYFGSSPQILLKCNHLCTCYFNIWIAMHPAACQLTDMGYTEAQNLRIPTAPGSITASIDDKDEDVTNSTSNNRPNRQQSHWLPLPSLKARLAALPPPPQRSSAAPLSVGSTNLK